MTIVYVVFKLQYNRTVRRDGSLLDFLASLFGLLERSQQRWFARHWHGRSPFGSSGVQQWLTTAPPIFDDWQAFDPGLDVIRAPRDAATDADRRRESACLNPIDQG
jgi:hypothetical protein